MKREWKAGDVAMVNGDVCMFVGHRREWEHGRTDRFAYDEGAEARLLAVIDPEDREQVERLAQAYLDKFDSGHPGQAVADQMQAALREFANPKPPKPDEPQGLGAVVEDIEGVLWIRADADGMPWMNSKSSGDYWQSYADITAVRVLSEGWSE